MSGISKSQVSRLCEEIDDKVKAFLEPRRLAEKALTAVVQEAYIQGISTAPWTTS